MWPAITNKFRCIDSLTSWFCSSQREDNRLFPLSASCPDISRNILEKSWNYFEHGQDSLLPPLHRLLAADKRLALFYHLWLQSVVVATCDMAFTALLCWSFVFEFIAVHSQKMQVWLICSPSHGEVSKVSVAFASLIRWKGCRTPKGRRFPRTLWIPKGESHIKGERCYSALSPARLISYPQWLSRMSAIPSALLFVLRKIPLSPWEYGVGASDTKVKTHLSCLNKSDKEMLYELPPEGSPKKPRPAKWP